MFKKTKFCIVSGLLFIVVILNIAGLWLLDYKINILAKEEVIVNIPTLSLEARVKQVVNNNRNNLVQIVAYKKIDYVFDDGLNNGIKSVTAEINKGSGIGLVKSGYVLTSKHVIIDTTAIYKVVYNGEERKVDKIWFDDTRDIALLKLDMPFTQGFSTKLLSQKELYKKLDIASFVVSLGYQENVEGIVASMGIISALNASLPDTSYDNLFLTDIALIAGNSGGPLLDMNGNVIALNTANSIIYEDKSVATPVYEEILDELFDKTGI